MSNKNSKAGSTMNV